METSLPPDAPAAFNFGAWLADQEWHFAEDGQWAWILNDENRYLLEGIYEDSEERLVPNPEMKLALQLMAHAPKLIRFTLRALELLHGPGAAPLKVAQTKLLLEELAGTTLRYLPVESWQQLARDVQHRQATAGEAEGEEDEG